jgi:ribosome-associated protein
MSAPEDVTVSPDGIRLGQLLKLVGAVDTGGEVKGLLESGEVTVNGRVTVQRGAQLGAGDVVAVHGRSWRLA